MPLKNCVGMSARTGNPVQKQLFQIFQLLLCLPHLSGYKMGSFYAPEGTSGGILKSHRLSVRTSVHPSVTNCVSAISHKVLKQI